MQDQHKQLPTLLPSLILSGTLQPQSLIRTITLLQSGIIRVLFISPEKLFSSLFRILISSTSLASQIRLIVIDEAHCISSWSYNFRSDYLRLHNIVHVIRQTSPHCSLLALTATGGSQVRADICQQLELSDENVVDCGWRRKEVQMCAVSGSQPFVCLQWALITVLNYRLLLQFLKSSLFSGTKQQQNVIIFVPFRRDTTAVCEFLQSHQIDVMD